MPAIDQDPHLHGFRRGDGGSGHGEGDLADERLGDYNLLVTCRALGGESVCGRPLSLLINCW
jgi:hypothetical protein